MSIMIDGGSDRLPRPRKSRRICSHPRCTSFSPPSGGGQDVIMTIDEYEVIRLIDLEGLTQEQCADQMDVARTTVQAIYANARKKLAQCIVLGNRLTIGGGDIRFCEHRGQDCGRGCCRRFSSPCAVKEAANAQEDVHTSGL